MKTIAIVGKPNVGKSSLFNRLAKSRIAITSDISGTTRDTNATEIIISDKKARLIDTGGIEKTTDELFAKVAKKAIESSKKADIVLYVVDGKEIPSDEDKKMLFEISKHAPCFLVINKIDNDAQKEFGYAFGEFGVREMFLISVTHNRGISKLLSALDDALFGEADASEAESSAQTSLEDEILAAFGDESAGGAGAGAESKKIDSAKKKKSRKVDSGARADSDLDFAAESDLESSADSQNEAESNIIKIGIIGRVNVGKSSLLNALVGQERSIVSSRAGTTIDPVSDEIEFEGKRLHFVDTAGIRKRGKIHSLEKFALDRTSKILDLADIAILVLDASEPLVELDEKISSLVQKHALGVIVVWNKWDIRHTDFKAMKEVFSRKFRFLEYAPFLTLSATNKRHITELKQKILEVYANYAMRIPTAKLNESIAAATKIHPIPSDHGKLVKIYYATQYATKPPQIALISNRPKSLHFSYKRFLVNRLRKEFGLSGTPIILTPRDKSQKDAESKDTRI